METRNCLRGNERAIDTQDIRACKSRAGHARVNHSKWGGVAKRGLGRGVFPHQLSGLLDFPLRRFILSPRVLASRLSLRPDFSVLEIGCGSGYYSIEVAKYLPSGDLKLFDIQPEMIQKCMRRVAASALRNVSFATGDGAALPFTDAQFDLVYMVTVLGEVRDREACLKSIMRVLRPGGLLSISEHLPDPDFISITELARMTTPFHFRLERRYGPRMAYTANFRAE